MGSHRRECHGGWNKLVIAVKLEILFRSEGVGVLFRVGWWTWLDALGDIGEDFAGTEHAVCIEASVSVRIVSLYFRLLASRC